MLHPCVVLSRENEKRAMVLGQRFNRTGDESRQDAKFDVSFLLFLLELDVINDGCLPTYSLLDFPPVPYPTSPLHLLCYDTYAYANLAVKHCISVTRSMGIKTKEEKKHKGSGIKSKVPFLPR